MGVSSASMASSDITCSSSSSSRLLSPRAPASGCHGAAGRARFGATCRWGDSAAGAVVGTMKPGVAVGSASPRLPQSASRSMMSRRKILPSLSSSRQITMAWNVSGLSHRPAIIARRPASMRLAIATSPSRESKSTEPISRKYRRTGSSARSDAFRTLTGVPHDVSISRSLSVSSGASSRITALSVDRACGDATMVAPAL